MDIWHKLGWIFRLSNFGTVVFFLLNIVLLLLIFFPYGIVVENVVALVLCYFITIIISLSSVGEWILAALAGAKEIKRTDIKIRLIPLLEIVYNRAKDYLCNRWIAKFV